MKARRVALFADCFHEVNGVALTSREFVAFARRRQAPLLAVVPAAADRETAAGAVSMVELGNSRFSFGVESDLRFDAIFARHRARLRAKLERFAPDVVHVTSPGHIGILGAILAHDLQVPLAAS